VEISVPDAATRQHHVLDQVSVTAMRIQKQAKMLLSGSTSAVVFRSRGTRF